MKHPYYDYIDVAKGIGILLVIMGHTMFPLHAAIDVMHMPLFFILAGITFRRSELPTFLLRKTDRIMVPYVFFALMSVPFALLTKFEGNIINYNGPLWFLQTLFCASILAWWATETKQRTYIVLLFAICFSFCAAYRQNELLPFHLDRAVRALVFVLIGTIAREKIVAERSVGQVSTSILLYGTAYVLLFGTYYLLFHPFGTFKSGQISNANYWLFLLSALSGTLAIIYISKLLHGSQPLQWLGRNSLVIMCVHFPFAEQWNVTIAKTTAYENGGGNLVLLAMSSYAVIVGFSIFSTFLLRRIAPQWTGYRPLLK